ncbi:MAG: ABC transporter ATP-binding protein [Cryobacterium sp.]
MNTVIQTRGLHKNFGRVLALDGLDLTVEVGEIHGFLGPNGAGKSTTIRILLGLMRSSGGSSTVFGRDPWTNASALHRRMAYVPGDVALWPNLSGGEAIDLLGRLRGAAGTAPERARRAHLLDAFNLDPSKKGRTYSTGNRQKVALVAALSTPADLYVLDEPTSGLDPLMVEVFRREIQAAAADGAAVLLSSHVLSEVEHLCDRVTIIRAGRTVETGTLADLRHLTRTAVVFAAAELSEGTLGQLASGIPGVHDFTIAGGQVSFTAESDTLPDVLPLLADLRVQGLRIAPPSLEELFLRHYHEDVVGPADRSGAAPPS